MSRIQVLAELLALKIDVNTISFYQSIDELGQLVDSPDSDYGLCDISGKLGYVSDCVATSISGDEVIHFRASETLIGGVLGKLAGAF